jgi:oxygen-independent coproporphyrinogen-3 oxidase
MLAVPEAAQIPFERSSSELDRRLLELIQKYDVNGPRYTSYPPAPVFTTDFSWKDYRQAIAETELRGASPGISLYFHIPFCDTLCYFCGCHTVTTHNRQHIVEYLDRLKQEVAMLAPLIDPRTKVVQMHWGGGTPTYLSPAQISGFAYHVQRYFELDPHAEMSVEIDPRELTREHVRALRRMGFNRASLGVQDFNPRVQYAINRNQSEFITRQAVDWIRDEGFGGLNLDLIYGLPLQTVASFEETIDRVIAMSPERIAVYNFAYVPKLKPHQKLIHMEDLPSSETKLQLLAMTVTKLTAAGYVHIGMDHFAKPDDELTTAQHTKTLRRNFQGYSTKAGSNLFGLGMSAISHFGPYYAQNAKTLRDYYQAIDDNRFATHLGYRMTRDDEIRKHVVMTLMCDLMVSKSDVEQRFGIDFEEYFQLSLSALVPLSNDGLVAISPQGIAVTPNGKFFLRNIAMCFDAYRPAPSNIPAYSRTI